MAVNDVSFKIEKGELGCIIGPNGAGKTTLFNIISGHLKPDSGKIYLNGKNITGMQPYKICRKGMGRSFQITNIFPRLSVYENVQIAVMAWQGNTRNMYGRVSNLYRNETFEVLHNVGLQDKHDEIAGELAYGDQRRLDVAIALSSRPEILLLDEPTAGMSPAETQEIVKLIMQLAKEKKFTLLFVEHDLHAVFAISQIIRVLNNGTLLVEGEPEKIRNNDEVQRIYFGGQISLTNND